MKGFTDLHSHFIYGLDDGARNRAVMEAMLDAAHAQGIASMFATPHATPGVQPFNHSAYMERLNEARQYCLMRGYDMELYSGAEVLYSPAIQRPVLDHELPTLADSEYVLLEFAPEIAYQELDAAICILERGGYIPILAHMERYSCLYHGKNAVKLKEYHEVSFQVNANTLITERGFFKARQIKNWFRNELIDYVASDAHDLVDRPYNMKKAYHILKRLYGANYARRLTGLK